ncbi:XrtA/PEP-CTERM system TPR-repeat protein PrsT [Thalassotalea ganghwensis]
MKVTSTTSILALTIALSLSGCGEPENAENYLKQANQYLAEGKFQESIIVLKNAVRLAPKSAEARLKLGHAHLGVGNGLDAVKELEKAQQFKSPKAKVLPLLARAYLITNDNLAILSLEDIDSLPEEAKLQVMAYKTLAAIREQQIDLAESIVTEIEQLNSANPYATLAAAYYATAKDDVDHAEALVAKVNSNFANIPEVIMLAAQIASAKQEHVKASKYYQQYEKLQPQSRLIYLLVSNSLLKAEKYQEAEAYADRILKAIPNQPLANYVKASVRYVEKDHQAALEHIEVAIRGQYAPPLARLIAGVSAYQLGYFEKAHLHLGFIVDNLLPEHPAKKMFIISQFQLGLIDDLTESIGDFSPQNEADQNFLSSLSYNLYSIGAIKEAKELVGKAEAVEQQGNQSSAKQGLLKLMMNDSSGFEDLEGALSGDESLKGKEMLLAYAALHSGNIEKAEEITLQWQKEHPESPGSYNMQAAIYLAKNQPEQAIKALKLSLEKDDKNFYALTELAKVYFQTKQIELAKTYVDKAVTVYPQNPKALRYFYAVNKDQSALDKINQAYQEKKQNVELTLLYIDALIDAKQFDKAQTVSTTIEFDIKTPKKAWFQRINIYRAQQSDELTLKTIESWLNVNPYHIEPVFLITDYYAKNGQAEKAYSYFDKALANYHKENLPLKAAYLQLLLDTGKAQQASELFQDEHFEQLNPDVYSGFEGRLAIFAKNYSLAAEKLTPFYQRYPSTQNALLLSLSYQKLGKNEVVVEHLTQHLEQQGDDDRVRMMLANSYLGLDRKKAIQHYIKLLETQPENIIVLNNLAWLSMDLGDLDQALNYAKRAYEIKPDLPNVVDTYGMVTFKQGDQLKAWKLLKKAYELSNHQEPDIAMNFAEVLIANNQDDEAKEVLKSTLSNTKSVNEKKNSLLKKIANKD